MNCINFPSMPMLHECQIYFQQTSIPIPRLTCDLLWLLHVCQLNLNLPTVVLIMNDLLYLLTTYCFAMFER